MKQLLYKTIKELEDSQDIQIIDGDRGKNYPKKEEFKSTGFCVFLNASNIKDDSFVFENIDFISEEKDNMLRKGKLSRKDIVITTRGTVGLAAYYGDNILYDNMRINSGMIIIRVNSNVINPNYFYQLLKSKSLKKQYQLFASGCAQPQLPIQDFRLINIPIFSKTHQDKIAKVLSNYDDLIENNNKRIKILEEMAQKIYKEWFVDFKFPGHETATFKQTELGKIPLDWEVKQIGKEYKTYLGGTPSRNEEKYWNGNIPWLNSGKTNELRIIKASEYITELGLEKSSTKLMPQYTTVLAITGATLGQVSMLGSEMCANQSVVGIYSDTNPEYVFYLMKDKIQKLVQNASGGAQQHINKDIVNEMKFVLPADTILDDFKNSICPINKEIFNLLYKNRALKQTRDLLLPRLISGGIDVENLEIV